MKILGHLGGLKQGEETGEGKLIVSNLGLHRSKGDTYIMGEPVYKWS